MAKRSCRLQFIETKKGFKLFRWGEAYSIDAVNNMYGVPIAPALIFTFRGRLG
jgi:hypothetical protein